MNKILVDHIENMFYGYDDKEIKEIKNELIISTEDKYNDFLSQGIEEYEAIGRVLSELGTLDDLLNELNLEVTRVSKIDREHGFTVKRSLKIGDKLISVLFLLVTAVYLLTGFIWGMWGTMWIMYPIAALVAAIINVFKM